MLQEILKNVSSPDRSLRSIGLMRVKRTYDGVQVLSAFGLGLMIGAGLALLLAPLSGPNLRKRVRESVNGRDDEMLAH
jgi:hypothetical protein